MTVRMHYLPRAERESLHSRVVQAALGPKDLTGAVVGVVLPMVVEVGALVAHVNQRLVEEGLKKEVVVVPAQKAF